MYSIVLLLYTQTVEVEMPFCAENVCIEFDEESGHMYGVGSRSHVTFLDDRVPASTVGSLKSLDPDCGERRREGDLNCQCVYI